MRSCLWALGSETTNPDAGSGGLAEVNSFAGCKQGHRFVVLAFFHCELCTGAKAKTIQKFEKLAVLFIDADDFGLVPRAKLGKRDNTLFAKLRDATANGHAMRATTPVAEALEKKLFDFGRNCVLEALGFVVRFGPGKTDNVRQKHFSQLMTQRHVLGQLAAFAGKVDTTQAIDADEVVASQALQSCRDRRRRYAKFLSETSADGRLAFLQHFPNGFEVVLA